MSALLHDAATVSITTRRNLYGAHAVRYHDAGATAALQVVRISRSVSGSGALVLHRESGFADRRQRPGYVYALPLAAAQVPAPVLELVGISSGFGQNVGMDGCVARGIRQRFARERFVHQCDILRHRSGIKRDVLVHHGNRIGDDVSRQFFAADAVEEDLAAPRLIQAGQQLRGRGLSAAGWANEGNARTGADAQREIVKLRLFGA